MADIAGGLVAAGVVDRWRDMALELWLAAGGIALAWALLLGLCMAWTDPRKVDPGPETLDLGGPEPPAIVNLLANDWRLEDESMPATLLDLAARKHVAIEQVGDRTFVRVPTTPPTTATPRTDALTPYEDMILDHVRGLARQGGDGMVPAEALTTGPDAQAKGWWKTYRTAVERDARDRGLARKRWSPAVHTLLVATALVVAGALALAVSALPEDEDDDSNPVGAALGLAVVSWGGMVGAVEGAGRRPRDTPAGREVAARWLGLREMLAQNPLFAEQPPAGVAIWDRHIAHGAALGVAHGAVAALPLGAESDTTAWSAVGGRWRVVHIRYPSLVPPGYGRHPLRAAAVGLFQLAVAGSVLSKLLPALLAAPGDLEAEGVELAGEEAFLLGVQALVTGIGAIAVLATARAAWMFGAGALDLVGGRRIVQGRVLRFRTKGSDDRTRSYMAVDDGTAHRVRAWCFHRGRGGNQGSWVRAEVTRHLQHVKDLTTVAAPDGPSATTGATADTTSPAAGQGTPSPVGTTENPPARTNAHEMTASGE